VPGPQVRGECRPRNGDVSSGIDRDPGAVVRAGAAEVRRVDELPGRVEVRDERIAVAAAVRRLNRVARGEVVRCRRARDERTAGRADRHRRPAAVLPESVLVVAAKIRGVHKAAARRAQRRDEHVVESAAVRGLKRIRGREVRRQRDADDVGLAAAVNGNLRRVVRRAAAEVRRVRERARVGDLGDEDVHQTAGVQLEGIEDGRRAPCWFPRTRSPDSRS
jgi:hypothetical protein